MKRKTADKLHVSAYFFSLFMWIDTLSSRRDGSTFAFTYKNNEHQPSSNSTNNSCISIISAIIFFIILYICVCVSKRLSLNGLRCECLIAFAINNYRRCSFLFRFILFFEKEQKKRKKRKEESVAFHLFIRKVLEECSRNHTRNQHAHTTTRIANKSKDIPSQIKMIYSMVKISCISHFIDNLHAFAVANERTSTNVSQHVMQYTKRFKIFALLTCTRNERKKRKSCIPKNMLINFIESIVMYSSNGNREDQQIGMWNHFSFSIVVFSESSL